MSHSEEPAGSQYYDYDDEQLQTRYITVSLDRSILGLPNPFLGQEESAQQSDTVEQTSLAQHTQPVSPSQLRSSTGSAQLDEQTHQSWRDILRQNPQAVHEAQTRDDVASGAQASAEVPIGGVQESLEIPTRGAQAFGVRPSDRVMPRMTYPITRTPAEQRVFERLLTMLPPAEDGTSSQHEVDDHIGGRPHHSRAHEPSDPVLDGEDRHNDHRMPSINQNAAEGTSFDEWVPFRREIDALNQDNNVPRMVDQAESQSGAQSLLQPHATYSRSYENYGGAAVNAVVRAATGFDLTTPRDCPEFMNHYYFYRNAPSRYAAGEDHDPFGGELPLVVRVRVPADDDLQQLHRHIRMHHPHLAGQFGRNAQTNQTAPRRIQYPQPVLSPHAEDLLATLSGEWGRLAGVMMGYDLRALEREGHTHLVLPLGHRRGLGPAIPDNPDLGDREDREPRPWLINGPLAGRAFAVGGQDPNRQAVAPFDADRALAPHAAGGQDPDRLAVAPFDANQALVPYAIDDQDPELVGAPFNADQALVPQAAEENAPRPWLAGVIDIDGMDPDDYMDLYEDEENCAPQ